ncbi:unnamed protein product [Parajaminaea phylloscopi]
MVRASASSILASLLTRDGCSHAATTTTRPSQLPPTPRSSLSSLPLYRNVPCQPHSMGRTSAGPQPTTGSTSPAPGGPIRPGALSRAQQPAPKGAMQSGAAAANDDNGSPDASQDSRRGRSAGRNTWQSQGALSDDDDAIGPLPRPGLAQRTDSGDRRQRSSSRDSSLARRLSAGLSGVLRGRSGSVERGETGLSRQGTDVSTIHDSERGRERGREAPMATGRGGAGNMFRSPSRGRPTPEQGEAAAQQAYAEKHTTMSSGRGGAGNVRSPSRDPLERQRAQAIDKQEREIQAAALRSEEHAPHAVGRGGVGNVARESSGDRRGRDSPSGSGLRSMSRSRSRDARSASRPRGPPVADRGLTSVDESSSIAGSEKTATHGGGSAQGAGHQHSHGLLGKIAAHIPGHHSHHA